MIVDESTEFGARVAAHLRDEIVVWMTVVAPKSGPIPMPVWFLWEGGESVLMFSQRARGCAISRRTRSCR